MKIWLVCGRCGNENTSQCDGAHVAFSSKELAEAFVNNPRDLSGNLPYGGGYIEELELDTVYSIKLDWDRERFFTTKELAESFKQQFVTIEARNANKPHQEAEYRGK